MLIRFCVNIPQETSVYLDFLALKNIWGVFVNRTLQVIVICIFLQYNILTENFSKATIKLMFNTVLT